MVMINNIGTQKTLRNDLCDKLGVASKKVIISTEAERKVKKTAYWIMERGSRHDLGLNYSGILLPKDKVKILSLLVNISKNVLPVGLQPWYRVKLEIAIDEVIRRQPLIYGLYHHLCLFLSENAEDTLLKLDLDSIPRDCRLGYVINQVVKKLILHIARQHNLSLMKRNYKKQVAPIYRGKVHKSLLRQAAA